MSKVTTKLHIEFTLSHVADKAHALSTITDVVAMRNHEAFPSLPKTKQVYIGLIAEAFETKGLDAAVLEMLRYGLRHNLQAILKDELLNKSDDEWLSGISPVRISEVK